MASGSHRAGRSPGCADRGPDVGPQPADRLLRRHRRRDLLDGRNVDRGHHRESPLLAVSGHDVDGLNSGYARLLLEDYLENPDAVPAEWRELFESGDSELVASHPGLLRLLETLERGNGHPAPPAPPPPPTTAPSPEAPPAPERATPAPAIDETLLGGVAAAM